MLRNLAEKLTFLRVRLVLTSAWYMYNVITPNQGMVCNGPDCIVLHVPSSGFPDSNYSSSQEGSTS